MCVCKYVKVLGKMYAKSLLRHLMYLYVSVCVESAYLKHAKHVNTDECVCLPRALLAKGVKQQREGGA